MQAFFFGVKIPNEQQQMVICVCKRLNKFRHCSKNKTKNFNIFKIKKGVLYMF